MNLRDITPIAPGDSPGDWLPGLLQALLVRAQFVRAEARALGWRGIRPGPAGAGSWTCRVHGMPGVYGLLFEGEDETGGWLVGRFSLHYFPHPEEPRALMFPLAAAALAQTPDYFDRVRAFAHDPGACGPFAIAMLELAAAQDGQACSLGLAALSRQRAVALDGIPAPGGGYVVAPGGLESDVPAYCLALHFFKTLAATATHGLGEPPERQRLRLASGRVRTFDASGVWSERGERHVRRLFLDLDYGQAPPPLPRAEGVDRLFWRRGLPPGRLQRQAWRHAHEPEWLCAAGRKSGASPGRPELLILSGFLGAGKTTLLRRLIEHCQQRDRFVAVIQNELGEVGLDGRLLEGEASVVEIDEGCVCCSLAGQLAKGLVQVLERFRPDLVVLETSGLANPKNLLGELGGVAELVTRGALVVVADGPGVEAALAGSAVARDQVEAADVLVLNKTDLLRPGEEERIGRALRALNPGAALLPARGGDIPFGLICDLERGPLAGLPGLPRFADLRPAHAAEGYAARTVRCPGPVAEARLLEALRQAAALAFRIKGVVDVGGGEDGVAAPHLVQIVAGRVELAPLAGAGADRWLTCIGQGGLDAACAVLRELWSERGPDDA